MSSKKLLFNTFDRLIEEIKPQNLIAEQCRYADETLTVNGTAIALKPYKKIHLFGSGKAVLPMAEAVQGLLGEKIAETLIVGAYEESDLPGGTRYIRSTHPLPTSKSVKAAKALREKLESLDEEDFFIYLLSGGNSALVELPEASITLEELQTTTSMMLKGGMPIEAINCVRKHLSRVKGGKLAHCTRAKGIVLVLSDVLGDDLHAIGSAPLYFDTTTFEDAITSLQSFGLFDGLPQGVQHFLREGAAGKHPETPKSEKKGIRHFILGSNALVLNRAGELLEAAGLATTLVSKPLQGDARELAAELVDLAESYEGERHCFILGGEATVNVKGEGRGGRNQHLALCVMLALSDKREVSFLSAATDGVDGNSDAAGALIDTNSRVNAKALGIDPKYYLETFDSNAFFAKTGELLMPGPTRNNLLDIVMMVVEPNIKQGELNG